MFIVKSVIIIAIAFVLLFPVNGFTQKSEIYEDFDIDKFTFDKYTPIEDYQLISKLVSQGLTKKIESSLVKF